MYKLLPILLFAFLIAEENQEPNFVQSDSLDVIWAEEQLDSDLNEFKKQVANIINEDKFLINVDKKVNEVVRVDTTYHEMNTIKYKMIIVYKLNIEVNIDKSIELDNSVKQTIESIINIIFQFSKWKIENITFNSVDINKLKNKNKQLILNRDDIYDDSWAVIIGIDKYENLSNLDYAVADAEAVQDMLVSKFDYKEENIKLLLNEEANKTNIVNVISDVSLNAGKNDRILIFYSGHGETMHLPDGGEMGYLLPIDGSQDNLFASAIPMDDLTDFSNMSKAKHMLFLVDACYGGLAAVGTKSLDAKKTPNYIEKITNRKSRQIITAGGKTEKVIEKSEWGHSAFTKNLLSALGEWYADSNSDSYITADELGDYLSEKVTIDSENQQTPQSRRLTSHEGEFIFMHSENTVVIQNKSADKKLDYLISEIEELKSQKSSGDNQIQEDLLNSSNLKFNRDTHKYIIASLHSHFGIRVEDDRFINDRKQAISFGLGMSPSHGPGYGLESNTILFTVSPSFSIKNYLGESGDIYWHYGLGLNLLTEFKENPNSYYGFEALIGWGQIGFKGNSIIKFIPTRSMKISTGYQVLFLAGEGNKVVDHGIEFKVAYGFSHKRSYSKGVKIYQD